MSRFTTALLGALSVAAIGCSGEYNGNGTNTPPTDNTPPADNTNIPPANDPPPVNEPPPGPPAGGAVTPGQGLFDANVRLEVAAACGGAGTGCHTNAVNNPDPQFIDTDPALAYGRMMLNKSVLFPDLTIDGKLVENGTNGHKGVVYSPAVIENITAWFAQETIDLQNGTGNAIVSPLSTFSGCMNLDEWNNSNVANSWADKGSNQGDCDACHNLGADGFFASNQSERMFKYVAGYAAFIPTFFTLDAAGTSVIINRTRILGVSNDQNPLHIEHGNFNIDGGNAMNNLVNFYDQTMARVTALEAAVAAGQPIEAARTAAGCIAPRF